MSHLRLNVVKKVKFAGITTLAFFHILGLGSVRVTVRDRVSG